MNIRDIIILEMKDSGFLRISLILVLLELLDNGTMIFGFPMVNLK